MLKIYHLKCSLTEQFLLITFLTVAVAATQSCARKTKTIALVPATAFSLAATLRKLLATLSNWRKYCPKDLSHAILLLGICEDDQSSLEKFVFTMHDMTCH
jgi:hypothetical protein